MNAGGVWADEVRTLDEGTDPDSIRPAKGIHITVPWHKVRNQIAAVIPVPEGPALGLRRARRAVHLHRHDRHRLRRPGRRPAVHRRGRRLPAPRHQRRVHRGDHHRRRRRHLGRPAAAGEVGGERPHRRPVPAAQRRPIDVRRRHDHRRQAHDLPRDGGRHRRRGGRDRSSPARSASPASRRVATRKLRLRGAEGYDTLAESARAFPDVPAEPRSSTSAPATAARRGR